MKVLAVSSGGGHWIELLRVMAAFEHASVTFVSVKREYAVDVPDYSFHVVRDATRWNFAGTAVLALQMWLAVRRLKPDVVVTTGAAPGYFAVRFGKWAGARTIWIDSLANVDELSGAGRMAGKYADLWLTQWPKLARPGGPEYSGQVI